MSAHRLRPASSSGRSARPSQIARRPFWFSEHETRSRTFALSSFAGVPGGEADMVRERGRDVQGPLVSLLLVLVLLLWCWRQERPTGAS